MSANSPATSLLAPVLDGGVRNTHFFQGRLLTAEDLRAEQDAHRQHHRELGRAVGAGVVEGLEVALRLRGEGGATPVVEVGGGFAVNREGQILRLPRSTRVALARSPQDGAPPDAGLFAECQPPGTAADPLAAGAGAYVLVMSPASGFREQAPRSGLGAEGTAVGCGSRWAVEGVTFRLQQILPDELSGISEETRSNLEVLLASSSRARMSLLRNLLAHLCFGTEKLAGFGDDPFALDDGASAYLAYGALDDLRRAGRLGDCDVPLALLHWTSAQGVVFVDAWSVRRRPVPRPPEPRWPTLAGARRRAEAEAALLQFLDHVDDLVREEASPRTIKAIDYFRYLPPAGYFPLHSLEAKGFSTADFFRDLPQRSAVFLETSRFASLLARSLEFPPLDLSSAEPVWLYQVPGSGAAGPFQVYARSSMAFEGLLSASTQDVPNLFGKSLADARGLLELGEFDLRLTSVVDIYGNVAEADDEEVQERLVLAQTPRPRERVPAGTVLQVAISAPPTVVEEPEPEPPPPGPRIVSYDPAAVRPGESVSIQGDHFGTQPSAITVTFVRGETTRTAQPTSASTATALHVTVPADLPAPARNTTAEVAVSVTVASGAPVSGPPLTLLPPPPLQPAITAVSPTPAVEGTTVTIEGQQFDYTDGTPPSQKTVLFNSIQVVPSSATATRLQARVPSIGASPTTPTTVSVRVVADGQTSAPASLGVLGPPLPPPPPPPPAPQISSLSPVDAFTNQNLTVYGSSFHADRSQNRVEFRRSSNNTLIKSVIPIDGTTTQLLTKTPTKSELGVGGLAPTAGTAGLIPIDGEPFPDPEPEPIEVTITVKVTVIANGQTSNSRNLSITYFI